jgi:hypothetical protein
MYHFQALKPFKILEITSRPSASSLKSIILQVKARLGKHIFA